MGSGGGDFGEVTLITGGADGSGSEDTGAVDTRGLVGALGAAGAGWADGSWVEALGVWLAGASVEGGFRMRGYGKTERFFGRGGGMYSPVLYFATLPKCFWAWERIWRTVLEPM